MSLLIDQFCEAVQEWSRRTGDSGGNIVFWAMIWTGGSSQYPRVGAIDPASVPPERRERLTAGEVMGHHTMEQVKDWLETLCTEHGFFEPFLVPALIRGLTCEFERASEEYAKNIQVRRQRLEEFEAILTDPDKLQRTVDGMNRVKRERFGGDDFKPTTETDIIQMRDFAAKLSVPSLADQRANRMRLDVWRELTDPLLESDNLDAGLTSYLDQWRE